MTDTAVAPTKKVRKPNVGNDATKGGRVKIWQIGFYAFAIGASLIMIAAIASSFLRGNFPRVGLAITVGVLGLTWGLLKAKNDAIVDPVGVRIGDQEPAMRDFIYTIVDDLGVERPDEIALAVEAEIDMRERTRHFGRTVDRSFLVIGLPFVQTMTKRELAAILAHQLAHNSPGHVHEGPRALRSLREARQIIATERQGFVNAVYGSYARKMYRSVGGVAVAQEDFADELAARLYGTDALLSGLEKVDTTVVGFDQMLREYLVPALQHQTHPQDLYGGFGELMASSIRRQERASALDTRQARERDDFDLHPYPPERIAAAKARPHETGTSTLADGDAPAISLLDPAGDSIELTLSRWAKALLGESTESQTWEQIAGHALSEPTRETAALSFDEDTSPGDRFEQALSWAVEDEWHVVDEALKATKPKRQTIEDRRAEWAHSVVADAAAASEVYGWKHNWDGPPILADANGTAFDAGPIVDLLLAGDATAARSAFDRAIDHG